MTRNGLQDEVAVITGGAGGLGSAVATRLSEQGASLVIVDLDGDAAAAQAKALSGPAIGVGADVSQESSVDAYMTAAVERFGRVDLVHLNAGYGGLMEPVASSKISDFDRVVAVNLRGVYLGLRSALLQFERQGGGGAIVATSSGLGKKGGQRMGPYAASKHAILGLVRSAALEVAHLGIRVNALCPGFIDTAMVRDAETLAGGGDALGARAMMETSVPQGRYGRPEELAAAVVWLLSDEASYVTGAALDVDGGVLASAAGYAPAATAEGTR